MDRKAQFLKISANLPQGVWEDIVVVVKNEPYSWKATKLEVENDTPIANEILEILTNLKILP